MDDIYKEVDDDLRAEQARRLLRRYGGLAIVVVVLAGAGLAGWQGWRWHERGQDQAAAEIYLKAMQNADSSLGSGQAPGRAAASAGFAQVGATAPDGYRILSRLREAALQEDGGGKAAALSLWQLVADDNAADPLLRDLASLMWVEAQLDVGDPSVLQGRLVALTVPTNPWHGLAQEAQAVLDLRQGHTEAARRTLQGLAQDTTSPDGVRGRANGLLARLGGG